MANITLLGASYTDVPAVDLPKTGGASGIGFCMIGVAALAAGFMLRSKEEDEE